MLKIVAMTVRRPLTLLILVAMSVIIVLQRWHTLDEPLDRDIAGYAVLSHEMPQGRKLYSDLWERKPPLIFAAFAATEIVTGYGRGEIFLLNVVAALGTLVFVYVAGGIFAAALWTLLCGDILTAANQPNAEVFVNLCLAGGFAMLIQDGGSHRYRRAVFTGVMFASATLFKHHVIVICAALLAVDVVRKHGASPATLRSRLLDSSIASCVIAIAWLLVSLYFIATGRFPDFYDALFRQNAAYAGSLLENLVHSLLSKNLFPPAMRWTLAPVALVLFSLAAAWRNRMPHAWWLLGAYVASAWVAIALPGYFWAHYYQLLLPPLCVAAWQVAGRRRRWWHQSNRGRRWSVTLAWR